MAGMRPGEICGSFIRIQLSVNAADFVRFFRNQLSNSVKIIF